MSDAPGGKSPSEALAKLGPGTWLLAGEAMLPCPTVHLSACWPAISRYFKQVCYTASSVQGLGVEGVAG